jgi:hypothetical protein
LSTARWRQRQLCQTDPSIFALKTPSVMRPETSRLVDGDPVQDLGVVADAAKIFLVIMKEGRIYTNTLPRWYPVSKLVSRLRISRILKRGPRAGARPWWARKINVAAIEAARRG